MRSAKGLTSASRTLKCHAQTDYLRRMKDLTGRQFGRLFVLGATDRRANQHVIWECECACGNVAYITGDSLTRGSTNSCGCLATETIVSRNRQTATHGWYGTPEYAAWQRIKFRKSGESAPKVCARWRDDFEAFLEDVGKRPSQKHRLARIDKKRDFEPGNVEWRPVGRI
jgi:hypothetical protein